MSRRLALAALALLAPVGVRAALGPRYGGEATIVVAALPQALDPSRPADAAQRLALALAHETLVRTAEDGSPQPGLARAWTTVAGGREWVLELDPDARFHDDAPLTALDASRSLRRFLEARSPSASALAESLAPEGLFAPDDRHVVLRLRHEHEHALLPLASPAASITSASGAGAGPFLPTYRNPGQRLALTAFAGHVRGRPFLDRLTLTVVPDEARRLADVAAGRADAALDAGAPQGGAGFASLVLAFDSTRPPFDAPGARAAVIGALRAADVPAFVPGAAPLFAAAPDHPGVAPRGPVALTVADDVPARASQRVAAVLESLGMDLRVEARPAEAARNAATPLRLLLESPETPGPGALAAERRAVTRGGDDAFFPIATLPVRLATAGWLHGAVVGADGTARFEDAWIDR